MLLVVLLCGMAALPSSELDLTSAVVLIQQPAPARAQVFAEMLANEVYQRGFSSLHHYSFHSLFLASLSNRQLMQTRFPTAQELL